MAILVLRTGPSLTTAAREAGCWGPRGRSVSRSALKEPSAPPTAPHPGGPDASVRLIGLSYSGVPGNSVWGDDRRCLKKKTEFHGQLCENLHLNCSLSLEIHHACPILLPLRSLIRREVDSLCLMPFSGLAQTPPPHSPCTCQRHCFKGQICHRVPAQSPSVTPTCFQDEVKSLQHGARGLALVARPSVF